MMNRISGPLSGPGQERFADLPIESNVDSSARPTVNAVLMTYNQTIMMALTTATSHADLMVELDIMNAFLERL